jgi:hypothetical protein
MPSASASQSSTRGAALLHNTAARAAIIASAAVFALFVILAVALFVVRRKRRKDSIESALGSHDSSSSDAQRIALGGNPYYVSALDPAPVSVPVSVYVPKEKRRESGTDYLGDHWLDRETLGVKYAHGRQQRSPPPEYQQQEQLQSQPRQTRPLRWQPRGKRPLRLSMPTSVGPDPEAFVPLSRRSVSELNMPSSRRSVPDSLMPSSRRNTAVFDFDVPFGASVTKASRFSTYEGRGGDGGVDKMSSSRTSSRERGGQVPLPPPRGFPRFVPETVMRDDESWEDVGMVVDEGRILRVRRFFFACCCVCLLISGGGDRS